MASRLIKNKLFSQGEKLYDQHKHKAGIRTNQPTDGNDAGVTGAPVQATPSSVGVQQPYPAQYSVQGMPAAPPVPPAYTDQKHVVGEAQNQVAGTPPVDPNAPVDPATQTEEAGATADASNPKGSKNGLFGKAQTMLQDKKNQEKLEKFGKAMLKKKLMGGRHY